MKRTVRNETYRANILLAIGAHPLPMDISWGHHKPNRTLDQNDKLHAMFGEMASHFGYTTDEMKEAVLDEIGIKTVIKKLDGSEAVVRKSTTKYTIGELSDLIENLHRFAAEWGYVFSE